jgi:hypothetical protein
MHTSSATPDPVLARFEARADRSGGPDACHPWTGGYGQYGSPTFYVRKGKSASARRWLWEHTYGPLEKTKWVTPACENLKCVNIRHLRLRAHNDDVTRFWEKVFKTDTCWLWTGWLHKGYGVMAINQDPVRAHRFSWELHYGPIPKGDEEICVLHKCDVPTCVRPEHLFLGTDKDNNADMIAKGRQSVGPEHGEKVRRAREARANMQRLAEKAMGVAGPNEGGDT